MNLLPHTSLLPLFSYQELKDLRITRVVDSAKVLGNITLDVIFGLKQFVDQNSKLTKAFMTAQEEANTYIQKNRKGAAATFLRISKSLFENENLLEQPLE